MNSYVKHQTGSDDLDLPWIDFISDAEHRLDSVLAGCGPRLTAERVDDLIRATREWADAHIRAQASLLLSRRESFSGTAAALGIGQVRLRRIMGSELQSVLDDAEPDELDGAEDIRPLVAGARMAAQASASR